MVVDLNDPESILRWWKVWPARHDGYLDFEMQTQPQFAPAIREVQRRIASDSALSAMLSAGIREQREQLAQRSRGNAELRAYQIRHREFSLAA
ncbi:hypothetical protein [Pelomonas sp. KK5]|uniref:hypothetical protein n=1 Tax=Pelomonas sp. KK5 TaxID=1855730 RepID=UPI00097CBC25|nr:hypothetical protein [Pelomonas sp. KK5]